MFDDLPVSRVAVQGETVEAVLNAAYLDRRAPSNTLSAARTFYYQVLFPIRKQPELASYFEDWKASRSLAENTLELFNRIDTVEHGIRLVFDGDAQDDRPFILGDPTSRLIAVVVRVGTRLAVALPSESVSELEHWEWDLVEPSVLRALTGLMHVEE